MKVIKRVHRIRPKMPLPLLAQGLWGNFSNIPYGYTMLKVVSAVLLVSLLKYYFGGARNMSERVMHSKVVMVTVCYCRFH